MKKSHLKNIIKESIKELMNEQSGNARNITFRTCQGSQNAGQSNITRNGQVPQVGDILRINTNLTGTGTPRTVMVLAVSPNAPHPANNNIQNAQCQTNCPNCSQCFNWTTMQSCNTTGDPNCVVSGGVGWNTGMPTIPCNSCGCGTTPPPNTNTSAGTCNPNAWNGHSAWTSTFTNTVNNFPASNTNQPCNFLNQKITQFTTNLQGTGQGGYQNIQNCKLDLANQLHTQNNC